MSNRPLNYLYALICLLTVGAVSAADATKGWFGFTVNADVEGTGNPILHGITLSAVAPGSPAAKQGLATGDKIIAVEGIAIDGRAAADVQTAMHKGVGETVHLQLQRADGKAYTVALVAAAAPPGE